MRMCFHVFMVWSVVPPDDAFVLSNDSVTVFLECCVVINVKCITFGQTRSNLSSKECDV